MVLNQIKESVLYCLWSLELFARRYTTAVLGAQSALLPVQATWSWRDGMC